MTSESGQPIAFSEILLGGGNDPSRDLLYSGDHVRQEIVSDNGVASVPGTSTGSQYVFGMSFDAGGVTVGSRS